jgi:hypothetical protein
VRLRELTLVVQSVFSEVNLTVLVVLNEFLYVLLWNSDQCPLGVRWRLQHRLVLLVNGSCTCVSEVEEVYGLLAQLAVLL